MLRGDPVMTSSSPRLTLLLSPARSYSFVILAALVLLALCGPPSPAGAQVLYGSLVGNVTDETGAAIPGAMVTITHRETGASRDVATDATGAYRFPTVQSVTYTITVKLTGFRTFKRGTVLETLNKYQPIVAYHQIGLPI